MIEPFSISEKAFMSLNQPAATLCIPTRRYGLLGWVSKGPPTAWTDERTTGFQLTRFKSPPAKELYAHLSVFKYG